MRQSVVLEQVSNLQTSGTRKIIEYSLGTIHSAAAGKVRVPVCALFGISCCCKIGAGMVPL